MFHWLPSKAKTELEVLRSAVIFELDDIRPDTDEFTKKMKHVSELSNLIDAEKREKLNPNTLLVVLGNIGIAAVVIMHERDNIITTKLFPFLSKNTK